MPVFSEFSRRNLMTCHNDLVRIASLLIRDFDIRVVCGHRNEEKQNEAYESGRSKLQWPKSKHNTYPSLAFDIIPWPEGYDDIEKFYYMAGRAAQIADTLNISLRWGGDWDDDHDLKDQTFFDLCHFELVL